METHDEQHMVILMNTSQSTLHTWTFQKKGCEHGVYPLAIKHGNGKSTKNGGVNGENHRTI